MIQICVKLYSHLVIIVSCFRYLISVQDELAITHIQTILNGKALLPCDLDAYDVNDTISLITWYKNRQNTPIYSFDMRVSDKDLSAHWHNREMLNNRTIFRTTTKPAVLSIDNISEDDEGNYQCRIEFIKSRTKIQQVRLTVIVLPDKPKIIDERGNELISRAGPYEEGSDIKLNCIVSGGRPESKIKWWRGESLLESDEVISGIDNVKSNQVIIESVQRSDQHAILTCQASNNNISQPSSISVLIEIYFRPISVEILNEVQPFSEYRKYELNCESVGSRPPAELSWWLDKRQLLNHSQKRSVDGNLSSSTLVFTPTRSDNGKILTCRAHNSFVKNGIEEFSIELDVFYSPVIHLTLGRNVNSEDIEETDDVYFECKINANPSAYKVIWKHNGQILQSNQKRGIIVSNEALVLQRVTHHQSGNYSCTASNVEGDGISNVVHLEIMYKPVCKSNQKRIYGIGRQEIAKIQCEVDSYPIPETFKWLLNNSAETIEVPNRNFHQINSTSLLTYEPSSEFDFGTVMCWASNIVGQQVSPCVFQIILAVKPEIPHNCSLFNQSTDSLGIECTKGFDGGQMQIFVFELYDQQSGRLLRNSSQNEAVFVVNALKPGQLLKIIIYAVNSKGRSDNVILEAFTLKAAEKQTGIDAQISHDFPVLLGILISIIVILLLIVGVIIKSLNTTSKGGKELHLPTRPTTVSLKDKVTITLKTESEELLEKDEKNPDVVPANKDSFYQLSQIDNSVLSNEFRNQLKLVPNNDSFSNQLNTNITKNDSSDADYAELSINNAAGVPSPLSAESRINDRVIYAQIDHTRRQLPLLPQTNCISIPTLPSYFTNSLKPNAFHREVVTVKTPLIGYQQESCV